MPDCPVKNLYINSTLQHRVQHRLVLGHIVRGAKQIISRKHCLYRRFTGAKLLCDGLHHQIIGENDSCEPHSLP